MKIGKNKKATVLTQPVTRRKAIRKKNSSAAEYIVYHKPNCGKCCEVMSVLKKNQIQVQEVHYLETPPTEKELEHLLMLLHLKPFDLVRTKEKYYKEKLEGFHFNDHEWIRIMVENPILIERPILIKGNKAIIGRPIEKVLDFIKK